MDTQNQTFEQRLIRLMPEMLRYAQAVAGSLADGDDLLQSAIARAIAHKEQYRGGRLDGWLARIIKSIWFNQLKRQRSERRCIESHMISNQADAIDPFNQVLALRNIDAVLDTLPRDYRELFVLTQVQGFSYKEAGDRLNLKDGTVKSRISRIRQRLQDSDDQGWIDVRHPH